MIRQSFYFPIGIRSDIPVPFLYPSQDKECSPRSIYLPHAKELYEIMQPGDSVLIRRPVAVKVKRCLNQLCKDAHFRIGEIREYLLTDAGTTDEKTYWSRLFYKSLTIPSEITTQPQITINQAQ